jgi:NTE family protein
LPATRRSSGSIVLIEFWDTICSSGLVPRMVDGRPLRAEARQRRHPLRRQQFCRLALAVRGQRGFYKLRFPPPFFATGGGPEATSFYDTGPLRATLERLADFDRINSREVRVSVGAVDVETGNFAYFDNANTVLKPEHFMASGALPARLPGGGDRRAGTTGTAVSSPTRR